MASRDIIKEFSETHWYAFYAALGFWLICIAITSAFSARMQGRCYFTTPLYLLYTMAQIAVIGLAGIKYMPE